MSTPPSGRVQLALNVTDLEQSVEFYSRLFNVAPAKRKPGYANFAIESPPLKLVLIEGDSGGSINHLGVEVADSTSVDDAAERFSLKGMATDVERATTCCYAIQDKVWVSAPDGERWEYYTVLEDTDATDTGEASCCSSDRDPVAV